MTIKEFIQQQVQPGAKKKHFGKKQMRRVLSEFNTLEQKIKVEQEKHKYTQAELIATIDLLRKANTVKDFSLTRFADFVRIDSFQCVQALQRVVGQQTEIQITYRF